MLAPDGFVFFAGVSRMARKAASMAQTIDPNGDSGQANQTRRRLHGEILNAFIARHGGALFAFNPADGRLLHLDALAAGAVTVNPLTGERWPAAFAAAAGPVRLFIDTATGTIDAKGAEMRAGLHPLMPLPPAEARIKEALAPLQGWPMLVRVPERDCKPEALARLVMPAGQSGKTGRPPHPARAWYGAQGFNRGGRSMKELQSEMAAATGAPAPSERAIRDWERAASIKAAEIGGRNRD